MPAFPRPQTPGLMAAAGTVSTGDMDGEDFGGKVDDGIERSFYSPLSERACLWKVTGVGSECPKSNRFAPSGEALCYFSQLRGLPVPTLLHLGTLAHGVTKVDTVCLSLC